MARCCKNWLLLGVVVCLTGLLTASDSNAQVRRYEPSRPTVSPYLNLFRDDDANRFLPDYHALVRPLQQQRRHDRQQQRLLREQSQTIDRLQLNLQELERRQAEGPLVAPTGQGSWFNRPPSRAGYLNTSRFYSQSGTAAARRR